MDGRENTQTLEVVFGDLATDLEQVNAEIERAFERTGDVIAQHMQRAAKSGEADFQAMAQVILQEMAKIALQQINIEGGGGVMPSSSSGGSIVNVHMQSPQGGQSGGVNSGVNAGQIAQWVSLAVQRGSRYI